jgi:ligand-binding sensor domain-containing protein
MNNMGKSIAILLLAILMNSCNGQVVQETSAPTNFPLGELSATIPHGVMVVFQDSKGTYWFGGSQTGLYRYDGQQLYLITEKDGLCSHSILGIQEDHLGNVYFDTQDCISKFDGQQFQTLEVIDNPTVKNEWQLQPNDLWFRMGWNRPGPLRYDGEKVYQLAFSETEASKEFHKMFPNASFSPFGIYSIYKDSKGHMWFGTSSCGVSRYDGNSLEWLYEESMTTTPEGGALGIRSTLEDKDGYYWFTHARFKYKPLPSPHNSDFSRQLNYQKDKIFEAQHYPYFMAIVEDKLGDLWMAIYDDGVWRNTGKELIHYPVEIEGTKASIFSIYRDNNGGIWLITHNLGLLTFNGNTFDKFKP